MYKKWKDLFGDLLVILFVSGTVGIALKFITFFDKWVFFPSFPNIFDSTFLISAVLYLTWKMKRSQYVRKNEFQSRKPKIRQLDMELSVEKCMYQYCHEPFSGGGHTLYFGRSSDTIRPPPSSNSITRVMPKRANSIVISMKDRTLAH